VKSNCKKAQEKRKGFTLTEVMVSLAIFSLVMAGIVPVYIMCIQAWKRTSLELETAQNSSLAVEKLVYGVGKQYGLRSAVGASVVVSMAGADWTVQYRDIEGWTNAFCYESATSDLMFSGRDTPGWVLVGRDIVSASVSNTGNGLSIRVTSSVTEGRFTESNTMTTLVSFRN
jgi:prepilin-type N-terminal cleavage/methylation domain-containing protein